MMKKVLIPIIALLTVVQVEAQRVIADSGNHGLMTINTKENERMKDVEGSPYLNEEFQYGVATVEGKEPLKLFMRYNVATETFELKPDLAGDKVYVLPIGKAVYTLNGDTFVYDEMRFEGKMITGYFLEHFSGDHIRLLEKPVAEISEARPAKTGYDEDEPARIRLDEEFYIITDQGKVENVRVKHRDIKKAFNSDPAKKYLSDNKVRSLEDLIAFVVWLDKNS